jgi:CxxC-x17-CxxC domain-containing protein
MQDKTLKCVDCGNEFVFTAGEQDFYAQKGFTNAPTRCPNCRAARKASREGGGSYSSGGGGGYGGQRQMYPAVCAQCGKQTEVPFQPRGDKPVYCSDCYKSQRPSSGGGYSGGRSGGGYGGGRSSGGGRDRGGDRGRSRNDW